MSLIRQLLPCLGIVIITFCLPSLPVESAEKPKKIVLLETMPVPVVINHCKWFTNHLYKLGYHRGKSINLYQFNANGDRQHAENLLTNALHRQRPDLVVASATLASQAAYKIIKNSGIPMMFITVSDPVGAGLIKKIGIPTGENLTGIVHTINRQTKLNIAMRLLGNLPHQRPIRFGLIHSSYPSSMGDVRELRQLASKRNDVEFVVYTIKYKKVPEGLSAMFNAVRRGIEELEDSIDYWWEVSGPLAETAAFTNILLKQGKKKIVMGLTMESVKMGALLVLAPNDKMLGYEAAQLADAILKGTDPGTIPVNEPEAFDLGVNLTTALRMGIVIPPDLMKLAANKVFR